MVGILFGDAPIAHMNHPVRMYGSLRVMSHHDNGAAPFMQGMEQFHDFLARLRIEVAGRFIRQDQHRIIDESPGNCHTLLLTAGEFPGQVMDAFSQPDYFQCFASMLFPFFLTGFLVTAIDHRKDDVMESGGAGQQVVGLEDKPDLVVADQGLLRPIQVADILTIQDILATGGMVEAAHDVHHGAFAGTGGPHDGDKFAFMDLQIDMVEGGDADVFAHLIDLAEIFELNDGFI